MTTDAEIKRARQAAWAREWRRKNPEIAKARKRDWEKRNPEKLKAMRARTRARNKDKIKEANRAQYLRKRSERIASAADWAKRNAAKRREIQNKWNRLNKEKRAAQYARSKELGLIDFDKRRAYGREYARIHKDAYKRRRAEYIKRHPWKNRERVRRYCARKLQATPRWANQFIINEIYRLAVDRSKATGVPHEVDHIVPLMSDEVCGLHVEHNLRVIPKIANTTKKNKHIFTENRKEDQWAIF